MGKIITGIIALVVILGAGYWLLTSSQTPQAAGPSTSMGPNGSDNQGNLGGTDTGTPQQPGTDTSNGTGATVTGSVTVGTPKTVTVSFNGDAFSPKSITINKGDTVKWVATAGQMWVASAQHPDHTAYSGSTRTQHCPDTSGTAFDQCAPGTSYSFTFGKTGTWNYHDHLNASLFGSVVVQ